MQYLLKEGGERGAAVSDVGGPQTGVVAGRDGGPVAIVRDQPPRDVHAALAARHVEREVPVGVSREDVRGRLEEEEGRSEGSPPCRLV